MYSLSKNKNMYKIVHKKRKTKGWIISSNSYMDLEKIAKNLMNDIPKICLKRIDLDTTSSSIESDNKAVDANLSRNEVLDEPIEKSNQQDIDVNLSRNEVLDESIEKSNQQDIDVNLSRNEVLDESIEKSNQQVRVLIHYYIYQKYI
ncbi:uncharacterized protein LOC115242553 isoform X2 [Formica exsecta]|uniref:uncharacterized protein LOC115242553 isoform X2 n=1 Tax=Formica exsecta TaxID=72781 RepID=UPI001143D25E|nr:uncharacterized protein LOC115242553 isoform X2 [Formica exsecta]